MKHETMALPRRDALATHWTLDPSIVFLNHGSFGATPRSVLDFQQELRRRMEEEPVRFLVRELEPMLDAARSEQRDISPGLIFGELQPIAKRAFSANADDVGLVVQLGA